MFGRKTQRRGSALIYTAALTSLMMAMAVYAVDVGRVRFAKAQLQDAADAAARYAANGAVTSSTPDVTAKALVKSVTDAYVIDGFVIDSTKTTTTVGIWDSQAKTFTATTASPNAVKVQLVYQFTKTGRTPLFSQAFSANQAPIVVANAIACGTTTANEYAPPASGNLWLAGMAAGSMTQNLRPDADWVWDTAGDSSNMKQSPLTVKTTDLNVNPGDSLSFEGLSGTATYVPDSTANSADGDSSFIVAMGQTYPPSVPTTSKNGIANIRAPIGAVIAVFLTDSAPTSASAPSALDFNTAAQRDYTSISPVLQQPFFIGDGKTSTGQIQKITVPTGATRIMIGMMDAWQWNDNVGNFKFKIYQRTTVQLVK